MLLLTLRGTPTLYYGDEIGMHAGRRSRRSRSRDPFERNVPGIGLGRDGCRTPMQWDAAPHAGFSTRDALAAAGRGAASLNVASESGNPASLHNLYRRLILLRRQFAPLATCHYRPIRLR